MSRWWKWSCDAPRNLRTKRWPNGQGQKGSWTTTPKKTVNFIYTYQQDWVESIEGVGGFASAAEIHLLKPVKEEQETPAPSQLWNQLLPENQSRPNRWWNSWIGRSIHRQPASEDSIAAASKSADYLKKEYKVLTPQESDLWRRCHSSSQASQSGHGWSTWYLYCNRLKSVLQDNQVSITVSAIRWRNQYLSWSAWTRFTSSKTWPRFQQSLWQDWRLCLEYQG